MFPLLSTDPLSTGTKTSFVHIGGTKHLSTGPKTGTKHTGFDPPPGGGGGGKPKKPPGSKVCEVKGPGKARESVEYRCSRFISGSLITVTHRLSMTPIRSRVS